ncbi:M14 family metallopeptidase [Flagellimonas allohymeniacidonis]|uniref:Succinylglutamate desuccinylase n=1 Tax=Flagellimonas allohymeniacidonis TaxID=2517819 RepID=A0A4Q8QI08_9FLAO|nr:M14 family metallopeptidase [Allomuricauda hymeniacidonis]TAI48303.1 succinylglutamate desuccinylase [Allomuricauda hymeniacidonis]
MRTIILPFLICFAAQFTLAQNDFQKAFKSESKSTKENVRIEFFDDLGNSGHLPISIVKGKTQGPVFTIVAGVHGYEYPPIIATQKLLREINVEELSGTLIIVPIANMASFFTRTPFINPQDQKNLNNAFPGKNNGSITEQIAYFITTNIISVSDVFLDIHGGDACEDLLPFVCYYDNQKKPEQTSMAKRLSEKSGFEYFVSYPYNISATEPAKYTFKQAVQDGKIALSIECGKLGNVQKENVNLIKQGVYNMLETMGMYFNGTGAHKNIVYRNSQTYIKASVNSIFYSDYKAGDEVRKDDIVGYTTNEFGFILEEYTASKDGIILYMLATPPINTNDTVMCISSYIEN